MEAEVARELERVQKENFNLKLRIFSLEQELRPDRSTAKEAAFASEISTEIEKRDQLLLKAKLSIQSLSSENDTLRHRLQSVETLLSETEVQALEWKQKVSAFDAENAVKGKQAESAQNNFKFACQQIEEQKQKIKQQHYLILQLQNKLNPSAAPGAPKTPHPMGQGQSSLDLTQDENECLLEDIGVQWRRYVASIEAKHGEEIDALKKNHQQQLDRFFQSKNGELEMFQKDYAQLQETIFGLRNQNADLHRAVEDMKLHEEQLRQTAEHFKSDSMEKAGQIQQLKLALGEAEEVKLHSQSLQTVNASLTEQISDLSNRVETLIKEASERMNEMSKLRTDYLALETRAKQADTLERTLDARNGELSELRRDNAKYQEDNNTLLLNIQRFKTMADFVPEKEETIRKQLEMISELQNTNINNSYEINSLRDEVARLSAKEATIVTLTKQLESADIELKKRQYESAELNNLKSVNDQVVLELGRLKVEYGTMERDYREARDAAERLKAAHTQLNAELDTKEQMLADFSGRAKLVEEKLRDKEARISTLENDLFTIKKALEHSDSLSSELTVDLSSHKTQIAELKNKVSELEMQCSASKSELEVTLARLESKSKDAEFARAEKSSSEKILSEYRENLKKQEQEFELMMTEQNERIATLGKELDTTNITFRSACKIIEDMSVRLRVSKITNVKSLDDILSITSAIIRKHEGILAELDASNTKVYEIQLKADQTRSELSRVKKELDYYNGEIEGKDKKVREYLAEIDSLNRSVDSMRQEVAVAEKNLKEALDQRSKLKTYNNEYKDKIARQELRITSLQDKIKSQEVLVAERVKEIELSMQRQVKTFLDVITDHISKRVSPEIALSEIKRFELIFLSTEDALNRQMLRVGDQLSGHGPAHGDLLGDPMMGHINPGPGALVSSNVRPLL